MLCTKQWSFKFFWEIPKGKTEEDKSSKGDVTLEMERGNGCRVNLNTAGTPLAPCSGLHLLLTHACIGLLFHIVNPMLSSTIKIQVNVTGSTEKTLVIKYGT